jgi:hypothetical protein
MAPRVAMFSREMIVPKTYGPGVSFRISFPEREVNMSPMSKGRAQEVESTTAITEHRSHRRLRAAKRPENTVLALADALHDILREETRLAG